MASFIERFEPLARAYDVLLCDVWGVIHNGLAAFPAACETLTRFRKRGGTAVLITNAPRSGEAVARILDRLGVPRDAYDAIVSSGDVTRGIVASRLPQTVFHLGPQRDLSIFTGLDVTFARLESADYVVCSGLFDDTTETPESYGDMLGAMRSRALFMVCANPDIVVERGDTLVYCGGPWPTPMRGSAGKCFIAASRMRRSMTPRWPRSRRYAAVRRRSASVCLPSAIRSAPISRAPRRSASIICS